MRARGSTRLPSPPPRLPVISLAAFALAFAAGCGDTGQPRIEHPAYARGTAARAVDVGAWQVTLDVAQVGFGPVTFCAGRAASDELCPQGLAEVTSVSTIDALNEAEQPIGRVHGFVGTVRSAGFAYGITWLPTQTTATAFPAAPGGHSAHLEGTATSTTGTFRFVADVDVVPLGQGQHAVSAVGLDAPIDEATARLDVRLDPSAWLAQVDFDELAATGQDPVRVEPKSRAANAIVVGMTSLAPPRFEWSRP